MSALYFENAKTGKRYEVLALDNAKKEITLKGQYGQFTEPYDKERFEKLGYRLVRETDPAASERKSQG